jgi:hypothetical protein
MLLDATGPAYYVRKDLGACFPVTGFGPDESGLFLVKESDVDLLGDRYQNAIVLWELEPGVPFKGVSLWGDQDLFGIRRPTTAETNGWAVGGLMILALQNGIVALGEVRLSDGGLDDIAILLGTFRGASTPVHRVSGGGTIVWTDEITVQYGFAATVDAAGEARGVLQFNYSEADTKYHGVIDCLNVLEDHRAYASGVITGGTLEGRYFYFGVQDNGEGAGAAGPDLISLIHYSATPRDCHGPMPEPYKDWTNGNVQIKNLADGYWYREGDEGTGP